MNITHQVNLPDGTSRDGKRHLWKGEVVNTWCSKCGHATPHLYQSPDYPALVCLECHPEKDPEVQR